MTQDGYGKAREIFDAAEELHGDERERYLQHTCGDDRQLRARVNDLLEARQRMGAFLKVPAMVWRDAKIAGFIVDEVIAEGGMGVVLKATQKSPRRTVAIKLVRSGGLKEQALQRFELEAEVLGRLDHPGVARIFEVGTAEHETGSIPYFVMEYIEGLPVTEFADSGNLDEHARLELVVAICKAVHHAHLRGVVHRDLKPSNILVTEDGDVKILDFGVARVTDADLQLPTMHTQVGQILGTLPYMSPEQVSARNEDLDFRSDIYSLGVLTFELLTGRLPQPLKGRELVEAIRLINEDDPDTLGSGGGKFAGDLETIVAKCLRKRPERRYESAEAFAQDLTRYLRDEPVTARPASTVYQFKKFVRRNRSAAVWASLSVLFLVAGLVFSLAGLSTARHERNNAVAAAAEATELSDFLVGLLSSPDPRQSGPDVRVRDLLERASERSQSSLVDRPGVATRVHQALGLSYRGIGLDATAQSELEAAVRVAATIPGDAGRHRYHEALLDLSNLHIELGADDTVDSLLNVARPFLEQAARDDVLVYRARMQRGMILGYAGKFEEAETILRTALDQALLHLDAEDRVVRDLRNELGALFWRAGKAEEARDVFARALETEERLAGPDAPVTLKLVNNLGMAYRQLKDYPQAKEMLGRSLDIKLRTLGPDHPSTATGHHNLALVLRELGEFEAAETHHLPAVAVADTLFRPEDPRVSHFRSGYAGTLFKLGRMAEARDLHLASFDALEARYGPEHPRIVGICEELAEIHQVLGLPHEAEAWRVRIPASSRDD